MSVEIRELVALFNAGRYAESEARALELTRRSPAAGVIWKILGASLGIQGKAACAALQRAVELLPEDAEAHNNLGNALRSAGQLAEALASCRRALLIKPEFPEAYNNLGNALRDLGQYAEAAASYRTALHHKPRYAEAHNNLGNVLIELGQLEDAVASFRTALEMKPKYAEAYSNLGDALLRLGRVEEAAESCRRAVQINPQSAVAHNNLGNALCEWGRMSCECQTLREAVACCRQALQLHPQYAAAHSNLGNSLRELGRMSPEDEQLEEVLASCRRALEIDPRCAEAHNNLGLVLYDLWETEAAVVSYRRALAIKPQYPYACFNLAVALRRMGQGGEAEATCRAALELQPGVVRPTILLAALRADQGQFAEAEELYRQVIIAEPDSPAAWGEIPRLRKMTRDDSAWLSEAKRVLEQTAAPREEAGLCFAIGKYFDDLREFEQAFAYYRRANQCAKRFTPRYEPERAVQSAELLIRHYDREWLARTRITGNTSRQPVFVVGMPRSGTTLAEQILASHPQVYGAGELQFWNKAAIRYHSCVDDAAQSAIVLQSLADDCSRLMGSLSAQTPRVVDKALTNYQWLGLIHAVLPEARFIHIKRNPADTCLSIYFQNLAAEHTYANDLEDLAHAYEVYRRLMRHWRSVLPAGVMLEVPYEELVKDPEVWSRKMLHLIGLPWDARCLEFHRTTRTVSTASNWQVRQKINSSSVARWRNYERFVGPLLSLMDAELAAAPQDA